MGRPFICFSIATVPVTIHSEEGPRGSFLEENFVGLVLDGRYQAGKLVVGRIRESIEKRDRAKLVANGRRRHGREANEAAGSQPSL
jgi:hypothetical protein